MDVPSGAAAHVDFVLPLPGVLTGSVTMSAGAAAPAAQLRLWSRARADSSEFTADRAGRFHLKLLPGRYEVTATSGTASSTGHVLVRAGETSHLDLTVAEQPQDRPRITGIVLDTTGLPLPGAWVGFAGGGDGVSMFFEGGIVSGSDRTNEEGRFEIHPHPRFTAGGSVAVIARTGGKFGFVRDVKTGTDVTVALLPAATVIGPAVGLSGGSYEALVDPLPPIGPDPLAPWVRFVGEQFTLADLPPVPSVLRVRQVGNATAVELDLAPGETKEVDVRLSEELPVTGRVVDANGKAIDAYVFVVGETTSDKVAPDGSFVLKLPTGAHTISAWSGSHKSRTIPVVIADRPLDTGTIVLERFPSIGGVGIWWVDSGTSSCTIDHVAPGGPAARAGLLAGDVVVAVNGEPIEEAADAADLIRGPIGSPVTVNVRRNGAMLTVQLVRVDLAALTAQTQ